MFSFQEDLLHYVWKLQYFDFQDLRTTSGDRITIIHPGYHNFDAGPDFSSAKLMIEGAQWIGNLEIHIKSSDWVKHQHHNDDAYDNVILHVVYMEDEKILRKNGSVIPCLELNGLIDKEIFNRYHFLKRDATWIPCESMISKVDNFTKQMWLDRLCVERLERKCNYIAELLSTSKNDWNFALYILIGKYFGSKVNTSAFEQLCKSIKLDILQKNADSRFIIEALLYGQAGFLNRAFQDEYPQQLKKEYQYLKHKFKLRNIPEKNWKFFRLRPSNFPTIRLAQFSSFIYEERISISRFLEAETLVEIKNLLVKPIHPYWHTHFLFDKQSAFAEKKIGESFLEILLINAIVPIIFYFGKSHQDDFFIDKAIRFLQEIPAEKNQILKKWEQLQFKPNNAAQSQALIHLKKDYCSKNRCLECTIGHSVMKEEAERYANNEQNTVIEPTLI